MLLTPLYDTPSLLRFDLPGGDPAVPVLRQRRRFATFLGGLDDHAWAAPSRCEAWSAKDVVAHLVSTNQFWAFSIDSARRGAPTRFLSSFDPVTSPAELVDATRSQDAAEILAAFVDTTEAMAAVMADIDDDGWSTLGEAPPGHVPLRAVALHALWDAWVHERDVMLPLGFDQTEEPDEIVGCLTYAAALGPALALATGLSRPGAIAVGATGPDTEFVVEVGERVLVRAGYPPEGALHLTGSAIDLLEALSFRGPMPCAVPDEHRWLVSGLARVFDRDT